MIEVEEGHDVGVFLKENERELFVNPLSVCLAEEKVVEKVDGGSFPLKEGRGCGVVEVQLCGKFLSLFGNAH